MSKVDCLLTAAESITVGCLAIKQYLPNAPSEVQLLSQAEEPEEEMGHTLFHHSGPAK